MVDPERIIISRTDSIGDVVLTLPVAAVLKKHFPNAYIIFLGRSYTRSVIEACENIDEFADWDELEKLPDHEAVEKLKLFRADVFIHVFPRRRLAQLAKKAKIKLRIGASGRIYHWFTCNGIVRMSRRKSDLHEAQLNIQLLRGLKIDDIPSLTSIPDMYGLREPDSTRVNQYIEKEKFNLILHPGSRGSAREWGIENFQDLVNLLPQNRYKLFVTGTKQEGESLRSFLNANSNVTDLTGKFDLRSLIAFINVADGIVAASTGPLHIAAALGKKAIGLYAPMRPIHPGRWRPVGKDAHFLVLQKNCNDCKKSKDCICIRSLTPVQVKMILES